jgi:endonuclease-3
VPYDKLPFDINAVIRRIRKAVEPFPKAAMFELADRGFRTPFQQLVACIISIRTTDEVMLPTAINLFEHASTPAEIARMSVDEIDALIRTCAFHYGKAGQIRRSRSGWWRSTAVSWDATRR